jgi:hypothetical protein
MLLSSGLRHDAVRTSYPDLGLSWLLSSPPAHHSVLYKPSYRKADNLTAICEPFVKKLCDPGRLTTLWASTACYRDSFTFYLLM